jgi:hypothetical protein
MNAKRLGITLIVALALGALVAGSASAAVKTVAAQWYTGAGAGTTLPVGTPKTVTATIATHPVIGAKGTLEATLATVPVKLEWTGIACVGCKIENKAVNGTKAAEPTTTEKANVIAWGTGKIKFTGVTVASPAGCVVRKTETGPIGEIETKELVIHGDWMDTNEANLKAFIQFLPKAGPTASFASFFIESGSCTAISNTYAVIGTVFGESKENTGVPASPQILTFGQAVQETTGAELKVGANIAKFTGTGSFSLSPTEEFQIK